MMAFHEGNGSSQLGGPPTDATGSLQRCGCVSQSPLGLEPRAWLDMHIPVFLCLVSKLDSGRKTRACVRRVNVLMAAVNINVGKFRAWFTEGNDFGTLQRTRPFLTCLPSRGNQETPASGNR